MKQEAARHTMQREELRGLLSEVENGRMAVEDALTQLGAFPASLDLGHTTLDTAREARCGHPEVVYGAGKTPQELLDISRAVLEHHGRLLVTRATDDGLALLTAELTALTAGHDMAGLMALLEAAGVPCGPVKNIREVFEDPQVQHLGIAQSVQHPDLGQPH